MATTYKTILTSVGAAKLASAIASGSTVNLTTMAVGDGNGNEVTPLSTQSSLVREIYRASLNNLAVDRANSNYIIAEMVIPTTVGGWTVREVGIFDNEGAMIALANFPQTYKPQLAEGSARDLVIRLKFEVTDTDAVTLTIDPSVVLASRAWVTDNFALSVVAPGGTTGMVLSKKSNADGDVQWIDPTSGLNILVETVTETQTLAASQTAITLAVCNTTGMAVYVGGLRLVPSEFTIVDLTHITLAKSYPDGSTIFFAQNEPANAGSYLATMNLFSEVAAMGEAAQATARANLGVADNQTTAIQQAVIDMLYPVGEMMITRRAGNPATWGGVWAVTTWVAYAEGQTLFGFSASDSMFNTLDKEGGAKTVTLVANNLGYHSHTVYSQAVTTASAGSHVHGMMDTQFFEEGTVDVGTTWRHEQIVSSTKLPRPIASSCDTSSAGAHSHTLTVPSSTTSGAGGNVPFNILPPYVVAYMWKRTA